MKLQSGQKLLFVGDSITCALRDTVAPPLGAGYVQFVSCLLASRYPALDLEIVNRGVDGDTIVDLERRWDADVIAEEPDWVFLMIGVNDVLYRHLEGMGARAVSDGAYRETLVRLIERTRRATSARFVLLEPNPLEGHLDAPSHAVMGRLVDVLRGVGAELGVDVVEVFARFLTAMRTLPTREWMVDVPHPRLEGHMLMALAVLDYLRE